MIGGLYPGFLRLPAFKGKARIDSVLKRMLYRVKPTAVADGLLMWLDPMEWTQAELIAQGRIEPLTMRLFAKLLPRGGAYVDVGAHVGFHTLVARRALGPSGRVIAIEPQPYNCERILKNWELNSFENLELYVAVAGAEDGPVRLPNQAATDKARLSLRLPGVNDLPQHFHVPMLRLDSLLMNERIGVVHLVKIDAEGFEPEVLKGMESSFAMTENLVLEMLPSTGAGQGRDAILGLRERGFRLRTVTGEPFAGEAGIPENNVWATRWDEERIHAMLQPG